MSDLTDSRTEPGGLGGWNSSPEEKNIPLPGEGARGWGSPSTLEAALAGPAGALLAQRVLNGDLGLAQLWFQQSVLDRYRGQTGWRVMRTNSAGRVKSPDGWALDFGIAADGQVVHASAADLAQRLPPLERPHWAQHLVTPPLSTVFVSMRLGAHACIDDGDLREWA